ncbi:MAG: hypothetical protein K5649_06015 [Lachnospiraceae bacterium]|nr:hypothetical protein [Lachnospiraceae bacterium]
MPNTNQNSATENTEQLKSLAAMSEIAITNRQSTIATTLICGFIAATYIVLVPQGMIPAGVGIATILLALAPIVLSWLLYKKDNDTPLIKHVIGCGFGLLYAVILFTSDIGIVYLYAVPLLVIVTVYNDVKYTIAVAGGAVLLNAIKVGMTMAQGNLSPDDVTSLPMRVVLLAITAVFLALTTASSVKFQKIRNARVKLEEDKTKGLLNEVLSVSGEMTESISSIADQMSTLKDSVDQTLVSMEEVNSGTAESADAVQNQLIKTEEIQTHIEMVKQAAGEIVDHVQETTEAVAEGQKNITQMDKLTAQVDQAGKDVQAALETFRDTTSKMNSITELITNVADQTSLLALNASIEAARAGEAGRGFAVVASEISNLAGQTTNATDDINKLIENISSQLGTMVETIESLIRTGEEESVCATQTAESFTLISDSVSKIRSRSDAMSENVRNLSGANEEIVNSIQTISAITEEVTAHASTTYAGSEQNQQIVAQINDLVEGLNENAATLKSYS